MVIFSRRRHRSCHPSLAIGCLGPWTRSTSSQEAALTRRCTGENASEGCRPDGPHKVSYPRHYCSVFLLHADININSCFLSICIMLAGLEYPRKPDVYPLLSSNFVLTLYSIVTPSFSKCSLQGPYRLYPPYPSWQGYPESEV